MLLSNTGQNALFLKPRKKLNPASVLSSLSISHFFFLPRRMGNGVFFVDCLATSCLFFVSRNTFPTPSPRSCFSSQSKDATATLRKPPLCARDRLGPPDLAESSYLAVHLLSHIAISFSPHFQLCYRTKSYAPLFRAPM